MQSSNSTANSATKQTTFKIACSVTAFVALLGNLFVIFLFTRRLHWLSKSHNRCILSLAITDLLAATAIFWNPKLLLGEGFYQVSSQDYIVRELYCRVVWSNYLLYALCTTSLYTCVVLALERWLAVTKPIFYKNQFKTRHMNVLIWASWIAAFVTLIPLAIMNTGVHNQDFVFCRGIVLNNQMYLFWVIFVVFAEGILPFTLIIAAYVHIFRAIKASIRLGTSARTENLNGLERMKKVTKMTAIASFVLIISWLPALGLAFISVLINTSESLVGNTGDNLEMLFGVLVFSNSWINPLVYVFSNSEFRKAIKEIFGASSLPDRSQQGT